MQIAEHHREQFELAYATAWAKDRYGSETPEQLAAEIKSWRIGDTYGEDLPRLRFGWEGYQWARASQCLAQIEEPAQPVAEICSASHDDAEFGERAIKPLCDISGFEYGTPLYAEAAPAAVAGPAEPLPWTPGPNEFKDWCAQWFGPDSDDTYLAKAVHALPPMAQRFERSAAPALEAPAAPVGSARQFIEWMYSQPEDREPTTAEGALLEFEAHIAAAAPQAPAAPVGMPAQGDPAALLQLAEVLESGRSLINIERKEAAEALRRQAAAAQAAPAAPSIAVVTDEQIDAILDSPGGLGMVIADPRQRLHLFARRVLEAAAPAAPAEGLEALLNEALAEMKRIAETEQVSLTPTFHNEVRRPNDKRKFHMGDARRAARNAVSALEKAFGVVIAGTVAAPAAPAVDARDAARYRWLRDTSVPPHNFYLSVPDEFKDERYSPREVDAAIDAAIAAQAKEGGAA